MTESIDQVADDISMTVLRFGISKELAGDMTTAIIDQVKSYAGGGYLYIPKPSKKERNRQIRQMFNGVNGDEVCAKFKIGKRHLYRIIKQNT